MSQYKSAIHAQSLPNLSENSKYRAQARQLQELFPKWSNDDLQSLLIEVGGDLELAATRISDGVVERWDEVRKRDKKAPVTPTIVKDSPTGRGDSRGGRGGRGRGGSGRGGASRGRGGPSRGGANGHLSRTESPRPSSTAPVNSSISNAADVVTKGGSLDEPKASVEGHDLQNGVTPSTSIWTDASSSPPETSTSTTSLSAAGSAWGSASAISPWGGEADAAGSNTPANVHAPSSKQATKTPATSKLSWAQIARSNEKPIPPPVQQPQAPVLLASPTTVPPEPAPVQEIVILTREEPTTAQAPTWEEESSTKTALASETWPPTQEPPSDESNLEVLEHQSTSEGNEELVPEQIPVPSEAVLEELSKSEVKETSPVPIQATPALPSHATATPSPKLSSRSAVAHRNSARYKVTDQPVVMPSSFSSGIEKIGMQFGSLSLGGETLAESNPTELEVPSAPEPTSPKVQPKPHYEQPTPAPPHATAAASASLSSVFQQQQQPLSQQTQHQSPTAQNLSSYHTIPGSISQPNQSSQTASAHATVATSPIQQYSQQQQAIPQQQQQQPPSLSNIHQQHLPHIQHLPQQVQQSHSHHSYSQHGLPTHIDPSQQIQSSTQQQPLQSSAHSNYFRQSEAASSTPYFHVPTPPAGQVQDNPYGSFGQLTAQAQHQQTSHTGGFGSADYGYADNQRGFYDSYAQQSGFGGRNVLGHEDVKTIQSSQQTSTTTTAHPPTTAQTSQQHGASQATGPTQQTGQGPQQGYAPPPVPYYYSHPYPQNQYFGTPYSSGYGVPQPFVKYPTMFQPGPPGSAPSPASKQPGSNVGVGVGLQPQANPYNQALYQQVGYDDYQPHPHHSQHQQQQHQHSHNLGLGQGTVGVGSGEYGKQLYGSSGQGAMQGFMGLGSQSSSGVGGPASASAARGGSSPETPYKPYAAKDVGVGVGSGRGASVQQGQVQGQPQVQGQGQSGQNGPQGQGFYSSNRFGSGVGGVGNGVGGPQQNNHQQQPGPQAHLGYPQGGNEGNFYSYQPRQQQGYWQ